MSLTEVTACLVAIDDRHQRIGQYYREISIRTDYYQVYGSCQPDGSTTPLRPPPHHDDEGR